MVGGAGERPAKSSLTALSMCFSIAPLWRAVARLASECATHTKRTAPPAVSKMPCRSYQCLRRECGSVRVVMHAGVPGGNRITVMRSSDYGSTRRLSIIFI